VNNTVETRIPTGEEYPGREMGAEKVPHTEEPQVLKHVQPNEPGYHAVDH